MHYLRWWIWVLSVGTIEVLSYPYTKIQNSLKYLVLGAIAINKADRLQSPIPPQQVPATVPPSRLSHVRYNIHIGIF